MDSNAALTELLQQKMGVTPGVPCGTVQHHGLLGRRLVTPFHDRPPLPLGEQPVVGEEGRQGSASLFC